MSWWSDIKCGAREDMPSFAELCRDGDADEPLDFLIEQDNAEEKIEEE